MNTTTATLRKAPASIDFLAALQAAAHTVGQFLRMPAPGVPEAAAQLLRLAESYESTQPSYAADLRAAASMCEQPERSAR